MKVKRIVANGFLGLEAIDVILPTTGVVVISGDNGAGKSSLIEAVSVAIWGRTLRGSSWANEGKAPSVRVETNHGTFERERIGTRVRLRWIDTGGKCIEYGSSRKGQEEIDLAIGKLDGWRQTSVFSSQDLAGFSSSSDGDRKRLIEGLLDVDAFDKGLTKCRRDLVREKEDYCLIDKEVQILEARLVGENARVVDLSKDLGKRPDAPPAERIVELREKLSRLESQAREYNLRLGEARAEYKTWREAGKLAKYDGEKASRIMKCSHCGQNIPEKARTEAIRLARQRHLNASNGLYAAKKIGIKLAGLEKDASEQLGVIRALFEAAVEKRKVLEIWEKRALEKKTKLNGAREVIEALRVEVVNKRKALIAVSKKIEVLGEVEKVLGLRGVRSQILTRALSSLELVTNAWLGQLLDGVSVSIKPDSELKRGGSVERISLEVLGLGHSGDYRACSGGQRRRIDVSLLLAMAELRTSMEGESQSSTLFLDECFDVLDSEGIGGVSDALALASQDRCIVVITHSEELASGLEAALRIRVDHGGVGV